MSWADLERHEGTIYRAANFREVGKSGGRSHGGTERVNGGRYYNHVDYSHSKATFLYEFTEGLPPGTVIHSTGSIDLVDEALLCYQFGRRSSSRDSAKRKSEVVPVDTITRVEAKREIDEARKCGVYDLFLVNQDVDAAIREAVAVVTGERERRRGQR